MHSAQCYLVVSVRPSANLSDSCTVFEGLFVAIVRQSTLVVLSRAKDLDAILVESPSVWC